MSKWFMSSSNPNDLSLTIKGLLVALIPLSVTVVKYYGFDVTQDELLEILNQGFAAVAAVMIVVGLIRKVAYRVF